MVVDIVIEVMVAVLVVVLVVEHWTDMIILIVLGHMMNMIEDLLLMMNLGVKILMVLEKIATLQAEHLLVMTYMIEEILEICHHHQESTIAIHCHEETPYLQEIHYRVTMNMVVEEMRIRHHVQGHHYRQLAQDLLSQDEM